MNQMGTGRSYSTSLSLCKEVGNHFQDILEEAAKNGKQIIFIGDNLNLSIGVVQERRGHHKHMLHMFASAALVSDCFFNDQPTDMPQISLASLKVSDIVLSKQEYGLIRRDCISLLAKFAAKLPQLAFMTECVHKLGGENVEKFAVNKCLRIWFKRISWTRTSKYKSEVNN